jgi:arylsulfatase A-like enzyme
MMKTYIKTILAGVFLAHLAALHSFGGTREHPNVVFILSDDQRMDELGITGHPLMKTPNIDRLAHDGVLFENSFVTSSSCQPNRASLLTGQWERRHTVGWNSPRSLSREQWDKTLPMVLKRNGYVTAYVGKNHIPGLRWWDFDYYYATRESHTGFYPKDDYPIFRNATLDTQPEIIGEGVANFLETDERFVERGGEHAGVFLRDRTKEKPFFLYVNFNVPHNWGTRHMKQLPSDDELYRTAYRDVKEQMPLPPGYVAAADVKEPKLPASLYSPENQSSAYKYIRTPEAMSEQSVRICQTMTGIDRVVGQIQEQLQRIGQADNTIIIYSSDNGLMQGEHGYGGKNWLYDPSIRVPLIIYDPRLPAAQRGRTVEELVVSPDVAPTILDLCGIPVPDSMQGSSLGPLLRGEQSDWRSDFFCENLMLLHGYPLIQGVRNSEWKYIRYFSSTAPAGFKGYYLPPNYLHELNLGLNGEEPAYEELFHLTDDPLEQRNLANDPEYATRLAGMRDRCIELLRETRGDPKLLPTVRNAEWRNEAPPDEWKDVLPLMGKTQ